MPHLLLKHILPFICPGRGRGRQVIAVARTADVVVMMLDATKGDVQRSVQQGRGTHRASDGPMCLWLRGSVSNLAPSDLGVLSSRCCPARIGDLRLGYKGHSLTLVIAHPTVRGTPAYP